MCRTAMLAALVSATLFASVGQASAWIGMNGVKQNGIRQNGIKYNGGGENGIRHNGVKHNGIKQNGGGRIQAAGTTLLAIEIPAHQE